MPIDDTAFRIWGVMKSSLTQSRAHKPACLEQAMPVAGLPCVDVGVRGVVLAGRRTGYQIVLAPEGVPTISVSYWAFVAPALLWIGAALLVWRLSDMLLGRGWTVVARAPRPVAGKLSRIIAHSLSRQRVRGRAMCYWHWRWASQHPPRFRATYRLRLKLTPNTNGADITVTEPGSSCQPVRRQSSRPSPGTGRGTDSAPLRLCRSGPAGPLRR